LNLIVTPNICLIVALLAPFLAAAQVQKPFSLNDVSDLLKSGVTSNRIARLIEDHGVSFELDERALRRLKQDGANETGVSAVKRLSDQHREETQRLKAEAEAKARAEREQQQKEAAVKAEREREEREAKAKADRERQEKELKARAERERQQREAAAKAERE